MKKSIRAVKAPSHSRSRRSVPSTVEEPGTKRTAASGRATVRRTQQRNVVSIDLAKPELRALMIEQSRDGDAYITVYRGSRAEFIAAGVPEAAFPTAGDGKKFRVQTVNACSTGRHEMLTGAVNSIDEGFELEIGWGIVMPYVQGAHPAIAELARMLLIDVSDWGGQCRATKEELVYDLQYAFDKLAKDPRASGYKPKPDSPRLRISEDFRHELSKFAQELYRMIHEECEVFADIGTPRERRQGLSLVVDNTREGAR